MIRSNGHDQQQMTGSGMAQDDTRQLDLMRRVPGHCYDDNTQSAEGEWYGFTGTSGNKCGEVWKCNTNHLCLLKIWYLSATSYLFPFRIIKIFPLISAIYWQGGMICINQNAIQTWNQADSRRTRQLEWHLARKKAECWTISWSG